MKHIFSILSVFFIIHGYACHPHGHFIIKNDLKDTLILHDSKKNKIYTLKPSHSLFFCWKNFDYDEKTGEFYIFNQTTKLRGYLKVIANPGFAHLYYTGYIQPNSRPALAHIDRKGCGISAGAGLETCTFWFEKISPSRIKPL